VMMEFLPVPDPRLFLNTLYSLQVQSRGSHCTLHFRHRKGTSRWRITCIILDFETSYSVVQLVLCKIQRIC
jgi:hypothetical protein